MFEWARNGRTSEWLTMRFESNATMLIGFLLFVVAESMHVSAEVFDLGKIHIEMCLNRQGTVRHQNG